MIVHCPSCGNSGEYKGDLRVKKLRCGKCKCSFPLKRDSTGHEKLDKVWSVKGEKGLPVSLRVLKFRFKAKSLSPESEISKDGITWHKVAHHPAFSKLDRPQIKAKGSKAEKGNNTKTTSSKKSAPPVKESKSDKPNTPLQKRWSTAHSLASIASIAAIIFLILLSSNVSKLNSESKDLRKENAALRGTLVRADKKIGALEEQLSFIDSEFDRVKSSSEEFKKTKAILEDIKKSIDSHKLYLVVSLDENKVHIKIGTKTLNSFVASTGKGRTILKRTGKPYNFLTPRGKMVIRSKDRNPVWFKPDWAWLEKGKPLPANISIQERAVKGELGKYRLRLAGSYAIHGTRNGIVEGKKETHGCIRMGRKDLAKLYTMAKRGTEVYIY